jgi:dsDNA-binding SOS-regulon protein
MRNVSGYLTDDGKFFQDKKEAEAHERMTMTAQRIAKFVDVYYGSAKQIEDALTHWEQYRMETK